MKKRYGFVVPRFGREIAGGAETLAGALARKLAQRGDHIEVLSTCAKDNRTWENAFPSGASIEDGLIVRRFPVDERNLERWVPLQIRLSEGLKLSVDDQLDWMAESVNSTALYSYIAENSSKFDALFFAPYLFGTTFWGSLIGGDKSILIPCLHDEHFAYLDIMSAMFRGVRGSLFNAEPERDLARRLYGGVEGGEVGMGFEPFGEGYVDGLQPYLPDPRPYLLYVGRKETGKNVQLLIDLFISLKERVKEACDLRLVIAGGGSFDDLHRPSALQREDIIDIGHVSEEDKHRLIKQTLALCQPSTNESFAIVLMEAWLLKVPVLVHARCEVTRHHAIASSGGLYFGSQEDFDGVVMELVTDPALRGCLGRSGFDYVRERYDWSAVLARFDSVVSKILSTNSNGTIREEQLGTGE